MIGAALARLRRVLPARKAPAFAADYARADAALARLAGMGGDGALDVEAVLAQFDARVTAPLLGDVRALLATRRRDERLARWIEGAVAQVRAAVDGGLPVYERRTPPLRPGYPWSGAAGLPADVLYPARPHRFAFAPRYALAVAADGAAPQDLHALLVDWMAFARVEPALPFISNLVVIQRLLACTWACAFLTAAPQDAAVTTCRIALLRVAAEDVRYLLPRLGSSHPNNHLLLDRFAGWFIASFFPALVGAGDGDVAQAESLWLAELDRQTYDDGGSFEHSRHYHAFASEMATVYLLARRAAGASVPPAIEQRIGRMLRLQALLGGPDAQPPAIGDGTDDALFPLDDGRGDPAAAFRELYRAAFDATLPCATRDHGAVERAFWLLRGRLAPASAHAAAPAALTEFPDAGLFLFAEHDDATRCVLRTGPTRPDRTTAGHMHSDLLSVTLTVRAVPLLVDAGTPSYRHRAARVNAGPDWRAHFMGPAAHNGIVVEGLDPLGAVRGDFRGSRAHASAAHVAHADAPGVAFAEAELRGPEGFPSLRRGVVHLRGHGFVVYTLAASGDDARRCSASFQFDAACDVDAGTSRSARVHREGVALTLAWDEGHGEAQLARGREDPPAGWVSPAYGCRVEAPQLLLPLPRGTLAACALVEGDSPELTVESIRPSARSRAFRLQAGDACDHVVLNLDPAAGPVVAWGMRFEGPLLWLHRAPASPPVLRGAAGARCDIPTLGVLLPGEPPGSASASTPIHEGA